MSEIIQLASQIEHTNTRRVGFEMPVLRTDAVYAVFTSIEETLAAVHVAAALGKAMAVPVTLIHVRTIPYPLSLETPAGLSPVETEAFVERLRQEGIDVRVRVFLCRNERRAIPLAFKPHCLIVIGGQRRWWPTLSERWRRRLEAAGHFVVFVDKSERKETSRA